MSGAVYLTFDVECSMGGAWGDPALRPVSPERTMMGRYGPRQLGLPLIVDILRRSGLAGTFFVEAFGDELGYPGQTRQVCECLLAAGQDVQLHVHPGHHQYGLYLRGLPHPRSDYLADLPADYRRQVLAEAAAKMTEWTGKAPVAFRAGNMAGSEALLPELAAVGIRIDSSYTFPYAGGLCRFTPNDPFNGSKWHGSVLELALSGFYQPRLPGLKPARPLDLVAVSFRECREAIRRIVDAGGEAVVIAHSFSFFKVRDRQYNGGRPNRIVIGRFRRLCKWLAASADQYPVRTFSWLAEQTLADKYSAKAVAPVRVGSPAGTLARMAVQAYNNIYWT